jgi:hypothetical protein
MSALLNLNQITKTLCGTSKGYPCPHLSTPGGQHHQHFHSGVSFQIRSIVEYLSIPGGQHHQHFHSGVSFQIRSVVE